MEARLLALIKALHTNTYLNLGLMEHENRIDTYKEVRQKGILAPLIFTLYINDLPGLMKDPEVYMPKGHKFLSTDNMGFFLQVGLYRLLRRPGPTIKIIF